MSDRVFSISELREMIGGLLPRYSLRSVRLFGSYVRGEASPASDIDLLVTYGEGSKTLDVLSFGERLAELTGKSVDAFESGEVESGPFLESILRDGVVMYPC